MDSRPWSRSTDTHSDASRNGRSLRWYSLARLSTRIVEDLVEPENTLSQSATTVTAEEPGTGVAEHNTAPESRKSSRGIAGSLHNIGLSIIVISVIGTVQDSIVLSRRLIEPRWVLSFNRFAPYSLWGGLLLVFTGIFLRDRSWGRKPPRSD